MKNITLFLSAAVSVCLLQACHPAKNTGATGDDTVNKAADTIKKAVIVPIDKDDIKFITDIYAACIAEIQLGKLAKQQGQDKRIKNFGAMMVKDITRGKLRLAALAKAKRINLVDSVSTADQQAINNLSKRSGRDFDNAYLNKSKNDYKKAYDIFQGVAKHGDDKDIKAFANKNILTLKRHLDDIDAIHDSMK